MTTRLREVAMTASARLINMMQVVASVPRKWLVAMFGGSVGGGAVGNLVVTELSSIIPELGSYDYTHIDNNKISY